MSAIALDSALDLRELFTTGSILQINEDYDNSEHRIETDNNEKLKETIFGEPVMSFEELSNQMIDVDKQGYVKKKILEEGGGLLPEKDCTVSVSYSGFWEGALEPFDVTPSNKPMVVNLQDTGLLPGLVIAIESMLVGETAIFLLNYRLMYGEIGIAPRIKPKANCIFYIKLIKSTITPKDGPIDYSEKNIFQRVHSEVKTLYTSGLALHKVKNINAAVQMFRKGVGILHKCRLADEKEECMQQKLLVKLYLNLAVCYNKLKQPTKACVSCNELNRLNSLWNNEKALFQNGKALRMIGDFDGANKRFRRALKLCPNSEDIKSEVQILENLKEACNRTRLMTNHSLTINDAFKAEVRNLIHTFKENCNLYKLTLPEGLNDAEIEYIKQICHQENLFCNKIQKNYLLDKSLGDQSIEGDIDVML